MTPADTQPLVAALAAKQCHPDTSHRKARCPAHNDRNPSLSWGTKSDGWVYVKCHAGCTRRQILDALGMDWRELAPEPDPLPGPRLVGVDAAPAYTTDAPPGHPTSVGPAVAEYLYADENGALLFGVARTATKEFRAWHPDDKAGRVWSLNGTRRVIYRLPQVLAAVHEGRTVHIVEGEKDVHAIENAGGVATCNPGGVGQGWREEYSSHLAGAHVVIVADRDEPGLTHAQKVAAALTGVAADIRIVEAVEGKDAADHLAAGYSLDELVPVEAAKREPNVRLLTISQLRTLPPPRYLIDKLLVVASLANLFGDSGSYKSFLALDWSLSVATGRTWWGHMVEQGHAVYVAAEGASGMLKRIDAWTAANPGYDPEPTFRIIGQAVNLLDPPSVEELRVELHAQITQQPRIIVIDTLARSMPGGDENSAQDMGIAIEHVERIKREFDTNVLLIHHSGIEKGRERGSTALRGAMDSRFETIGGGGSLIVTCRKQKDDEEHPPIRMQTEAVGASLVLRPVDTSDRDLAAIGRVEAALRDLFPKGATKNQLALALGGRKVDALAAIDLAVTDVRSQVAADVTTAKTRYYLTSHRQETL